MAFRTTVLLALAGSASGFFGRSTGPAVNNAPLGASTGGRLDGAAPLALAAALAAATCGIGAVWAARQAWMLHARDFYTPFVFPPAAVALAFVCARGAASLCARVAPSSTSGRNTPLLPYM